MRYSDDDGGGPGDREPTDATKEASGVTITGAHQAVPRPPDEDAAPAASLDDWSFVRGTSPDPELPHWTEAPTGQVPAVLSRDTDATPSDDPWSSLPAPTWRQDETDWTAQEERFEPAMLGDEGGAAPVYDDDARRPWEFDEDATSVGIPVVTAAAAATAAPATRVRARTSRARRAPSTSSAPRSDGPMTGRSARPATSRDMPVAVATGVVLGLIVLIAYFWSTVLMVVLAAAVVVIAAGEAYNGMRAAGHRPAAALGLVASLSLMIASYNKGISALPLVTALCFVFAFLWFLAGVEHADVIDGLGDHDGRVRLGRACSARS